MSNIQDFESSMSFWTTCENLATVTEDVVGEEIEEMIDEVESAGTKRLSSEGEECDEMRILDDESLTRGRGSHGIREDLLFLVGVEYEDEYFESLSGNSWSKEQECSYCKVLIFFFNVKL